MENHKDLPHFKNGEKLQAENLYQLANFLRFNSASLAVAAKGAGKTWLFRPYDHDKDNKWNFATVQKESPPFSFSVTIENLCLITPKGYLILKKTITSKEELKLDDKIYLACRLTYDENSYTPFGHEVTLTCSSNSENVDEVFDLGIMKERNFEFSVPFAAMDAGYDLYNATEEFIKNIRNIVSEIRLFSDFQSPASFGLDVALRQIDMLRPEINPTSFSLAVSQLLTACDWLLSGDSTMNSTRNNLVKVRREINDGIFSYSKMVNIIKKLTEYFRLEGSMTLYLKRPLTQVLGPTSSTVIGVLKEWKYEIPDINSRMLLLQFNDPDPMHDPPIVSVNLQGNLQWQELQATYSNGYWIIETHLDGSVRSIRLRCNARWNPELKIKRVGG